MRTNNQIIRTIILAIAFVAANVCVASPVLAQRVYRESDFNMRSLIRRIETRTDTFRSTLQNALDNSRLNGTVREDEINRLVSEFEFATDQLRTRFDARQSTRADAQAVLERSAQINNFLINNRLDLRVNQDWRLLQADLDQLARAYYIDWRWDTVGSSVGSGVGSLNDSQMRQLLDQINNRATSFSRTFRNQLNRRNVADQFTIDEANRHLSQFETAVMRLRNRTNTRRATEADVREVLEHAGYLNNFMATHELGFGAENNWNMLRQDLDRLASASNVAWNWPSESTPGGPIFGGDAQLTGTYSLDTARSTDPRRAAEDATSNLPAGQRQRAYDSLIARLEAPDVLAIERRGNNVSIASSRAPQIDFVADGREHTETTPGGRTVRVRANFSGDQLTISRTGDRAQDFTVSFDPTDNGRRLIVTRRLYTPQLDREVFVESHYNKTSDVAQLTVHSTSPTSTGVTASGDFVIPNGTQVVAVLNSDLSTQNIREGDRFTMTVRSPSEYDGATIEGRVVSINRSGRVTGRSEMTLDFDTIRLRDGRSHRFAGILETVRTPGGDTVRVDNEGAVRDDNQTEKTIQRTAIGTAVGAIIGAIAGGGKGAAIGAVIGAGAGAGSVYVQGRDDLNLTAGTELTIRATGPRN
ncbi:MAG TPA: YMGG-like glycine zipper-containing protein [Pyrinomonadaceae bacterium]|nr:YMGG-like glycine zipper-containing protein [Pyrinomonadaceae bacterium]